LKLNIIKLRQNSNYDLKTKDQGISFDICHNIYNNFLIAFADFLLHSLGRKKDPFIKSLFFSLTVDVSLQIRYFLEGYPFDFVFLFLLLHFFILFPVSWIFFKFIK